LGGGARAARTLPAPWRWLGQAGRLVPRFIGDPLYDLVQHNRLDWFGKGEACFVPTTETRRRFLIDALP
jgi:predicted DCC family thiol-disulfide oxidoreductase YuxK